MSRRRKRPSSYRFPETAVEDVDAGDGAVDADAIELPARRSTGRSLTTVEDIESFVEDLCANEPRGEERDLSEIAGPSDLPGLPDLAELSDAINVAIDGLSFLQHVVETRTRSARTRRQTRTH